LFKKPPESLATRRAPAEKLQTTQNTPTLPPFSTGPGNGGSYPFQAHDGPTRLPV